MKLLHGDCREVLKTLPDNSVDSIVTDPPYELGFMGKKWDASGIAYDVGMWAEAMRVLKPGGHLLAFSGSRTYHRMTCAIEDAGFEVRDQIMWVYGSGFPKSLDVSKAIDKAAGAEREIIGTTVTKSGGMAHIMKTNAEHGYRPGDYYAESGNVIKHTAPATDAAKQWKGWGTALKPAHEPICVARKPLIGTVAENVLAHGTGAMNIDGCRVTTDESTMRPCGKALIGTFEGQEGKISGSYAGQGRFPANFIHDGLETEWSRFFYCAKASRKDRNEGCEHMELKPAFDNPDGSMGGNIGSLSKPRQNNHPTVKPTDLMRYLCRLVTPPAGVILDPFMGSGSTGKAAALEGFDFIGIDMTPEYIEIAKARIAHAKADNDNQLATSDLFDVA